MQTKIIQTLPDSQVTQQVLSKEGGGLKIKAQPGAKISFNVEGANPADAANANAGGIKKTGTNLVLESEGGALVEVTDFYSTAGASVGDVSWNYPALEAGATAVTPEAKALVATSEVSASTSLGSTGWGIFAGVAGAMGAAAVTAGGNAGNFAVLDGDAALTVVQTDATVAADGVINAAERAAGVVLSGTADSGASVTIATGVGTDVTVTADATTGAWTATVPQGNLPTTGNVTFTVTSTDAAGNTSAPVAITAAVETTAALTVVQTDATVAADGVINAAERAAGVVLSGTADSGASVTIATGVGTDVTVTADTTTGAWTATVPQGNLPTTGNVTFTVTSTDAAGNTAAPVAITAAVETTAALTVVQTDATVAADGVINAAERAAGVVLSGTADSGASVTIATGVGTDVTVTADATTGAWTATVPQGNLPTTGNVTFTVTSTDAAGNTSAPVAITAAVETTAALTVVQTDATVAADGVINAAERAAGVVLSGTADSGASVTIATGVGTDVTVTADATTGAWTATVPQGNLPTTGNVTFTVTSTDAAGNTSAPVAITAAVETTAALTVVQTDATVAADGVINAAERAAGVVLSGTADSGASVTIATGVGTDVTVTADTTTGAWTATVPQGNLPTTGNVTFTVTSTDAAGNTSAPVAITAAVETTAALTVVQTDATVAADGVINAAERAAGVVLSGTADSGASVTIATGVGTDVTVTADATTGAWTATVPQGNLPTTGNVTFTVTSTDAAGNTAAPVAITAAVDVTPPATNITPLFFNDNAGVVKTVDLGVAMQIGGVYISYADGGSYYRENSLSGIATQSQRDTKSPLITDDSTPEINGALSAPASEGDYVLIYADGSQVGSGVLAEGDTNWKVVVSTELTLGSHAITYQYFDKAGNIGTGSTLPVSLAGTNYTLTTINVVPTQPVSMASDGSVGTNSMTTYVDAVTGTDIVSDQEFDAGFSITGKINTATVTDFNKLKFFLDNDRTGLSPVVELGTELINGNSGVTITVNQSTGDYAINFAPGSSALIQANQTFNTTTGTSQGGSGVHKISVSYDAGDNGHAVGSLDNSGDVLASRLFLVASGTAMKNSTNELGSLVTGLAANFSVVDPITGKAFVYYYGDPDGTNGLGSAWTQVDPYDSSLTIDRSNTGEGVFLSDWDYWSSSVANTATPNPSDYALGIERINIADKVWEFAALKPASGALNWTEANAQALNHTSTGSNTSRLASLEEAVALYAANFGQDNGSFSGYQRVVGVVQPLIESTNSSSVIANTEWNSPSGWASVSNHYWTNTASPSGYMAINTNGSAIVDRAITDKMAALIIA